ncbi:4'-phosphopantetheinyl transferase family protein [Streptomyces sp. NBC_01262]|uniref:4'-phosphopantetheinyl transferase family protein n=1 Tax=Streptomyces sp. NBC_01262 TaxID=2903803 RepID=UPI002E375718|nr:4'-phosphopantetheinyl transferase superfamily protein [Streptomyces sp. NBC_01262]
MLTQLLPAQVVAVEATTAPVDAMLFPEEERQIRNAVDKRRDEYTTVRWCARRAMAEMGLPAAPVLPGLRGAPQWAPSVVGSMTHCAGYRAAALAHSSDISAIGIDAEPNEPLPEGVLEAIGLPQEVRWVRHYLRAIPGVAWDRLLFSMKESVYKTWFPLTGREMDFEDALITVDPALGTFHARLLLGPAERMEGDPRSFTGRWSAENGVLVSAIAVAAEVPAQRNAPHQVLVGSVGQIS